MREAGRLELLVKGARSLVWLGGDLFDVAGGWRHLPLDGSRPTARQRKFGTAFDAAAVSPSGDVVALIASTGTKALLLDGGGALIRELTRDSYKANAYRYPLALFTLPGGQTGLVHCPHQYDRLEVEDARTGERLTGAGQRTPDDLFHSRLVVSPSGRFLVSAGWVWQPWDIAAVYDLAAGLADACVLDGSGDVLSVGDLLRAGVAGACFAGDDVVVSTALQINDSHAADELGPNMLVCWSSSERRYVWRQQLDHCAGDLLPLAGGVLGLNDHPRWYDAATGEMALEWPDLATGGATSSIVWKKSFAGPARVAVDPQSARFAVTDGDRVVVITLA